MFFKTNDAFERKVQGAHETGDRFWGLVELPYPVPLFLMKLEEENEDGILGREMMTFDLGELLALYGGHRSPLRLTGVSVLLASDRLEIMMQTERTLHRVREIWVRHGDPWQYRFIVDDSREIVFNPAGNAFDISTMQCVFKMEKAAAQEVSPEED